MKCVKSLDGFEYLTTILCLPLHNPFYKKQYSNGVECKSAVLEWKKTTFKGNDMEWHRHFDFFFKLLTHLHYILNSPCKSFKICSFFKLLFHIPKHLLNVEEKSFIISHPWLNNSELSAHFAALIRLLHKKQIFHCVLFKFFCGAKGSDSKFQWNYMGLCATSTFSGN